jgi:hypothetical protein
MPGFCVDKGMITAVERTTEGALRVWATVSRTGDLTYYGPDGQPFVERVTADELFRADSLNTAWGKPITVGHPVTDEGEPIPVTPDNMAAYRVGSTGQSMQQINGQFLTLVAVIDDAKGIAEIERGTREISAGYYREPVVTDGVIHQTNRDYNHFAIGPQGRAGAKVRLHVDAETTITLPPKPMTTITIDGLGYPVDNPDLAKAIATLQKDSAKATKQIERLTADQEAGKAEATELRKLHADAQSKVAQLQADLDSVTGERDALKASQLSADAIAAAAQDRIATMEQAKVIAPDMATDWSKPPEQIRREAVVAKGLAVDGKSDEYISGVFSALVAAAPAQQRTDATTKALPATGSTAAPVVDYDQIRAQKDAEIANAWMVK